MNYFDGFMQSLQNAREKYNAKTAKKGALKQIQSWIVIIDNGGLTKTTLITVRPKNKAKARSTRSERFRFN